MNILYVGAKYDYSDPKRGGFSLEHYNFYESLVAMEGGRHHVTYFAFDEIISRRGVYVMNKDLLLIVKKEHFDLCFFVLFNNEIFKETLFEIKEQSNAITFNWFCDDHWRFHNFSKYYAPLFHWVSTTDSDAMIKYKRAGFTNVIKTQWGCNQDLYRKYALEKQYEVLFIGQPYGNRKKIISKMKRNGLKVECFGFGWPNGRLWGEAMVQKFSEGKININFARSSGYVSIKNILKIFFYKDKKKFRIHPILTWRDEMKSFIDTLNTRQIKTRNFEVTGSGGFLLTDDADNLEDYFIDGKEIVIFKSIDDLIEKANYYLVHDKERESIALAGLERTIRDHTYQKRFRALFNAMNLQDK